jgi:hypothetical protein
MAEFAMGLPNDMLDHLMKMEWWCNLLAYRDEGTPLFVAVRNNYLSVYVCGRAIFKRIWEERGAIHASFDGRYFYGPKTEAVIDGAAETIRNLDPWVKRVKGFKKLVILDDDTSSNDPMDIGEKECLASRAVRPSVINLEMALPGFVSKGKKIAPRIDMVHLEPGRPSVAVVFTEAKLFSNKGLRVADDNKDAEVVKQVMRYKDYLEEHSDKICSAYQTACKLLIQLRRGQKVEIDPLLEMVAKGAPVNLITIPRLVVFKTKRDEPKSQNAWEKHRAKIQKRGIVVEEAVCKSE